MGNPQNGEPISIPTPTRRASEEARPISEPNENSPTVPHPKSGEPVVIALVALDSGKWSIAKVDPEERSLFWWCGTTHEWVSPDSGYWTFSDVWNEMFPSQAAAARFATKKGWIS
jgi:hypothetical protein